MIETRQFWQQFSHRHLLWVGAGLAGLGLALAWALLFRPALSEARQLQATHELLKAKVSNNNQLTLEISNLEQELSRLRRLLTGDEPPSNQSEMVAHAVDKLDVISGRHAVELTGVTPVPSRQLKDFEEIPFTVKVSGAYLDIYAWLQDVERDLGPMVVQHFAITPRHRQDTVEMTLEVVAYRPMELAP